MTGAFVEYKIPFVGVLQYLNTPMMQDELDAHMEPSHKKTTLRYRKNMRMVVIIISNRIFNLFETLGEI